MPDAMQLYCDFLAGQSGTCIFTGEDGCHAFVTEDEIEATFGSRHDGKHFAWLDRKPGEVGPEGLGFLSDDHIDILLAENRIAFTFCDMGGPLGENREGVKAAFLLGASRMSRVLSLPLDDEKRTLPDAIDTLPLGLRARIKGLGLSAPIPLAQLIESLIPFGATIEDGEARGRLVVLSRVAVGADLADIEDEAERFAAWVADRATREEAASEITRQMLGQLTSDLTHKGKLQ